MKIKNRKGAQGFTLIELLVVVLIIGILAAVAVPQYFKVIEKGKAAEALSFVDSLIRAEESYLTKNGAYLPGGTAVFSKFDINIPSTMHNYSIAAIVVDSAGSPPTWQITLPRVDSAGSVYAPAYYGAYTVSYTGGAGGSYSCGGTAAKCSELLP